jgi:hypothetical protein
MANFIVDTFLKDMVLVGRQLRLNWYHNKILYNVS